MVKSSSVSVSLKSALLEDQPSILIFENHLFDLHGLGNDFVDSNFCLVFEKQLLAKKELEHLGI